MERVFGEIKVMTIKLKVGKRYITRNGNITTELLRNVSSDDAHIFPFTGRIQKARFFWNEYGLCKLDEPSDEPTDPFDIVKEYGPTYSDIFNKNADSINHPSHYTQGGIECIDAIKAALGDDGFKGFLRGNAIKYLWRMEHKGKTFEDCNKALWYVERLIKEIDNNDDN